MPKPPSFGMVAACAAACSTLLLLAVLSGGGAPGTSLAEAAVQVTARGMTFKPGDAFGKAYEQLCASLAS